MKRDGLVKNPSICITHVVLQPVGEDEAMIVEKVDLDMLQMILSAAIDNGMWPNLKLTLRELFPDPMPVYETCEALAEATDTDPLIEHGELDGD